MGTYITIVTVDAIIEFANVPWAAFEIKMGFKAQGKGAANLLELVHRIGYTNRPKPALLAPINRCILRLLQLPRPHGTVISLLPIQNSAGR